MKPKLQKFTEFANALLPHETQYLLSVQQFEDEQKRSILERIDFNSRNIDQFTPYDESLDKRKYSNLKNWIIDRLKSIDVDEEFEWMSYMERQISIDAIEQEEEKRLLSAIRQYVHPGFFFTKFYELVKQYRHFLLIRMRYDDHALVHAFLETYAEAYRRSIEINEEIHRATLDIVRQYSDNSAESKQWEDWLAEVFYDESLDGNNRYLSLVRLTFIGLNYRRFHRLRDKYDYLDGLFSQGRYYSKRILLNYYSNRLLLHTKFQEMDQAIYYGYLSIREKNHDFLLYVNNLCGVLLRQKRIKEALDLMKRAAPEMKKSKNFHNKVGFVAFYIKALNANGHYANAANYAESFQLAFKKEVFQYRWHLFFSTYLETLLFQKEFLKVIRAVRSNHLLEKDKGYENRPVYLPTIPWYHAVAEYKEGEITWEQFTALLKKDLERLREEPEKWQGIQDIFQLFRHFLEDDYPALEAMLQRQKMLG